jgi:hypothetical protein
MYRLIFAITAIVSASALASDPAFPMPMDNLYNNRLTVESAECLSINLFNVTVDPAWAEDPSHFTITSANDADFNAAAAAHPLKAGSRTRTIREALRKDLLVHQTAIFLDLPVPMKPGKSYTVVFNDGPSDLPVIPSVTFDDSRQINDNIRVNQLGYVPGYEHHAYIGQYCGSLGGMSVKAASFELLDSNRKIVFTSAITPRPTQNELVGQIVYDLDFTPFQTPGVYQLHVPGVGLSYPFEIGCAAMNPLYLNYLRGLYQERCGMEIDPAFSRQSRPACHEDDATWNHKVETFGLVQPKNPPEYPQAVDGTHQAATHGHHDAGDYGKYTSSGATFVFSALNAMARFPDKYQEDDLGLPYSGNGIPDLLEEVKWELDWLENMQDPADGGVSGVIKPEDGGYEQYMPPPVAHRLFCPKDTVFTAAFAGALAEAARSPIMQKYYPEDCKRYLAKALLAWDFLEKNNRYVEYFQYGAMFGDWDERCWAAVELYAATGDSKYHDYFVKNFDPSRKLWGWKAMMESVGYATYTYVFLENRKRDDAMLARCKAELRTQCQTLVEDGAAYPYRLSVPKPVISSGLYGWYFPGDAAGYDLLMGYAMDKDPRYLQCALDNISYTCGANPSGYFLMTGIGFKRNIEAVSNQSTSNNIIEPVPGLPLGIGTPDFYWLNNYGKKPGEGEYPAKWPIMNRWYDGFNVHSEFTTGPMMRETIVAGYFADVAHRNYDRPTVKITADTQRGFAPLTVHFHARTTTASQSHIRQYFWDFGDESFSTESDPVHAFPNPGSETTVAVTVLDQDGRSAYDVTRITAAAEHPGYPTVRPTFNMQTLLMYPLNGDLNDSSDHAPALSVITAQGMHRKPYHFTTDPAGWTAEKKGACLELDGNEQFAVEIPQGLLSDPAHTAFSIQMMLLLNDFSGWAYPGNPTLLGLEGNDSELRWWQGTWDRAMAPGFGRELQGIASKKFASDFPRNRWCQVRITYDGQQNAEFFVDGQSWGTASVKLPSDAAGQPLKLVMGPFRGLVSQLEMSKINGTPAKTH